MTLLAAPPRQAPPAVSWMERRGAGPALGLVTTVALILCWELGSRTGVIPSTTLPAASEVAAQLLELVQTPAYWAVVWQTLSSALLGVGLTVLIGVPVALAIGMSRFVRESTMLLVEFLKPIPPVAMIPLGLLLWGPTLTMKLTLITFGALWPFLVQMVDGVRQIDGAVLDTARSYRLTRTQTITRVILPSLLPFAATGLRVAAAVALIVAVVTELIGGAAGLGREIIIAQSAGTLPQMYALIVTAGILGLLTNAAFAAAEKPLLFWHPRFRKDVS